MSAGDSVAVVIAYDANDLSRIGTTQHVTAEEAKDLVREGRARYATDDTSDRAPQRADGGAGMGDTTTEGTERPATKATARKAPPADS